MKCPICKGKGRITEPKFIKQEINAGNVARALRKEGFKIREIARLMGFKNPGSVSHLLSKGGL